MSFYPVPTESFDAAAAERARKIEAGHAAEKIIEAWKASYERFWQTPRTHGDRALTTTELQQVLDRDKPGFGKILQDSASFLTFIVTSFPEHVGTSDRPVMTEDQDEAKLIPSRYLTSPYPIDQTLTITGPLKPEWGQQQ